MKESADGDLAKMKYVDIKLEALIPVLKREIPLKAHAHRADDILNALRIAKEFNLRILIIHATEGHLVAEKLKEANAACILGPSFSDGPKMEMKNVTFKTHKILNEAGVKIAIQTDAPISPVLDLPLMAAMAVREGLDEFEAINAITINAAEIYGIDNKVGSIEVGKDADIVITDISPLEFNYKPWKVLIDGKEVYAFEEVN
jgi:imidazolonepropionase-like amidohydrolase